jgi:transcriptional regulator with XRE-family HTH domain
MEVSMTRTLREFRGWTQEHLALVSGLSVRTIQRVEAGGLAGAETVAALAAAFDVSPSDIEGSPYVMPLRDWEEVITLPERGPVKVRRFQMAFPAGERPCFIVDRPEDSLRVPVVVGDGAGPVKVWKPRRVLFPVFTEADLFGVSLEQRLADTIKTFHACGFDDVGPAEAVLAQVTWATFLVGDEPVQHSMAATQFTFGAAHLRFMASLNVIRHERVAHVG